MLPHSSPSTVVNDVLARQSSAGFVQLMALVTLATISAVITAAVVTTTVGRRELSALERLVQTDALARSALVRLDAAMQNSADDFALRLSAGRTAEPVIVPVGENNVSVALEAEDGKIDVLKTAPELIRQYALNAGLSGNATTAMLARMDTARRTGDAGSAIESVRLSLLGHVADDAIEHDFTTLGTQGGIDPRFATERVLRALPDLSASDVTALIAVESPQAGTPMVQSRYFAPGGRHFSVVATMQWGRDATSVRRIPIEISSAGRLVELPAIN